MNLGLVVVLAVIVLTVTLWGNAIASCVAFERGRKRFFYSVLIFAFPIVGALWYRTVRLPALKAELDLD